MSKFTPKEKEMLDELRERAQNLVDYMQRTGNMDFSRVDITIDPDYKGAPYISCDVTTIGENEIRRSASVYQFQYRDDEWSERVSTYKKEESKDE